MAGKLGVQGEGNQLTTWLKGPEERAWDERLHHQDGVHVAASKPPVVEPIGGTETEELDCFREC